jgi:hypothetical protein
MSKNLSILKSARDAWRDVLNEGKVTFENKPVDPYLFAWSGEYDNNCTVCLAGAYFLQEHGTLLQASQIGQIEWELDSLRRGRRYVVKDWNTSDSEGLLAYALSLWPEGQYEIMDFNNNQAVLDLLNMLIENSEVKSV